MSMSSVHRRLALRASQATSPTTPGARCKRPRPWLATTVPWSSGGGEHHRLFHHRSWATGTASGRPNNGGGVVGIISGHAAAVATRNGVVAKIDAAAAAGRGATTGPAGAARRSRSSSSSGSSSSAVVPAPEDAAAAEGSSSRVVRSLPSATVPAAAATPANPPATTTASKRRHSSKITKRRSRPHSPLSRTAVDHPKNAALPYPAEHHHRTTMTLTLTRKQILRLTPKQRRNLYDRRLREYEDSLSYLDTARINVRKNLKFLGGRADTNLKKNIKYMKRLFEGEEEVWKDAAEHHPAGGGSNAKKGRGGRKEEEGLADMARGVDWESAPSEIAANLRSNLSTLRGWLHESTGGMIPVSSRVGINAATKDGKTAGSVATRVQQFHEMKKSDKKLVMDGWWIAKNVLLALMPGAALHVYFWSKQEEMAEYYTKLERMERERILGITADVSGRDLANDYATGSSPRSSPSREGGAVAIGGSGGMGISSVFVPEGGSAWDRFKMTINDVFLGGAEERIREHKELQSRLEEEEERSAAMERSNMRQASPSPKRAVETSARNGGDAAEDDLSEGAGDPVVRMLLERVRALERQIDATGNGGKGELSEEEHRQKEEERRKKDHETNYRIKRLRQSPVQNRRDDALAARWRDEIDEEGKFEEEGVSDEEGRDLHGGGDDSPYSFTNLVAFASSMMKPRLDAMKESVTQVMGEAMGALDLSEDGRPTASERDVEGEMPESSTRKEGSVAAESTPNTGSLPGLPQHEEDAVQAVSSVAPHSSLHSSSIGDEAGGERQGGKRHGAVGRWAGRVWGRICRLSGAGGTNDKDDVDPNDEAEHSQHGS